MIRSIAPMDPSSAPARSAGMAGTNSQMRVSEEFEAQVLGAMLQPMFEGSRSGAFGGGAGEATWQPMLVAQYGHAFARAGGIGLAQYVLQALQQTRDNGGHP